MPRSKVKQAEVEAHVQELLQQAAIKRHNCFNIKNFLPEKPDEGASVSRCVLST